jgi:AAA domain/Bifunctional DNA primase/polymerase, N-terminal
MRNEHNALAGNQGGGRQDDQRQFNSGTFIDRALPLARAGFRVLPLAPGGKEAILKGWPKEATTDEKIIATWAKRFPNANVGTLMGDGFVGLDLDLLKQTFDAATVAGWRLPPTRVIRTAHGGEHHIYAFTAWPIPCVSEGILAGGVCVKGFGGYLVGLGSIVDGVTYAVVDPDQPIAELPERFAKKILAASTRFQTWRREIDPARRHYTAGADGQKWVAEAIAHVQSGDGRNATGIWLACQLRDDRLDDATQETRMLEYQREVEHAGPHPYTEREALASLAQARKRPPREPATAPAALLVQPAPMVEQALGADTQETALYHVITAAALQIKTFEPVVWVVLNLIPQGLTVLSGKPKMGKSWLLLALGVARASGGAFLGSITLEQGPVLYLAMEDTEESLQDRLEIVLAGKTAPTGLEFSTDWQQWHMNVGGLEKLNAWQEAHPGGCIIIDTLAKIRPPTRSNVNSYTEDYAVGTQLKSIADKGNCSIIVVTHNRKAKADDPFDEINASTGIAGSMDTGLVIRRERGSADAVLHTTGRRISERSMALQFDTTKCQWSLMGDAKDFAISEARKSILAAVKKLGRATPKQIALEVGRNHNTVKNTVMSMAKGDELLANGDGTYSPPIAPQVHSLDSLDSLASLDSLVVYGETTETTKTTETMQTTQTTQQRHDASHIQANGAKPHEHVYRFRNRGARVRFCDCGEQEPGKE